MTILETADVPTPVGAIRFATRDGTLCALGFSDRWAGLETALRRRFGAVELRPRPDPGGVVTALDRYLDGDAAVLDRLPVETGGTEFQRRVWEELRRIPGGTTISYGELARRIGAPTAVRAVAAANGANPISIVIPCHRVIGADGGLTGYGGGLPRKRWLLAHERAELALGAHVVRRVPSARGAPPMSPVMSRALR